MAVTLTITSPDPTPLGKMGVYFTELLKIVGASATAADTGTVTPQFVTPIGFLGGDFSLVSYTSGVATIKANAAQQSTTTYATAYGYPK